MKEAQVFWNEKYKEERNLWGFQPKEMLLHYEKVIPSKGKILDLGVGEGKNALYFASRGYVVEGVDISDTAIDRCRHYASEAGLDMKTTVADLAEYSIAPGSCSLIILSNVLNFFHDDTIKRIVQKVKEGLVDGGMVYIHAFDVHDPSLDKRRHLVVDEFTNTVFNPKTKGYTHYFTKDELEGIFQGYKVIYSSQSLQLDLGHGEPHYHGLVELLVKK
ncbi:class I SAM-dependent methyltransferase [Bacillus sp. BHET2]|uniref:class I SAM-dependent methyltransferase n=1 Tax=Bacillus sp. BHET2 TaxID=2583818 RepID=UPI0014868543|nr:class I SAM-dependent methyltransferase [Bacillus sp. BHET2]